MVDLQCPVCKGDSYLNPSIKMFVSPCFHKICETCLYKHFQQGYAPCPECGTLLRRINFISSTFEDVEVEREIKMRKLMNRHFIRKIDDFENEIQYNDYLEEYENVLFDLLELKTEAMVKDKINLLKETSSILNSVVTVKNEEGEEVKRVKVEENLWCVYKPVENMRPVIDTNFTIPSGFMKPNLAGGLTARVILDFFVFSLFELNGKA